MDNGRQLNCSNYRPYMDLVEDCSREVCHPHAGGLFGSLELKGVILLPVHLVDPVQAFSCFNK